MSLNPSLPNFNNVVSESFFPQNPVNLDMIPSNIASNQNYHPSDSLNSIKDNSLLNNDGISDYYLGHSWKPSFRHKTESNDNSFEYSFFDLNDELNMMDDEWPLEPIFKEELKEDSNLFQIPRPEFILDTGLKKRWTINEKNQLIHLSEKLITEGNYSLSTLARLFVDKNPGRSISATRHIAKNMIQNGELSSLPMNADNSMPLLKKKRFDVPKKFRPKFDMQRLWTGIEKQKLLELIQQTVNNDKFSIRSLARSFSQENPGRSESSVRAFVSKLIKTGELQLSFKNCQIGKECALWTDEENELLRKLMANQDKQMDVVNMFLKQSEGSKRSYSAVRQQVWRLKYGYA